MRYLPKAKIAEIYEKGVAEIAWGDVRNSMSCTFVALLPNTSATSTSVVLARGGAGPFLSKLPPGSWVFAGQCDGLCCFVLGICDIDVFVTLSVHVDPKCSPSFLPSSLRSLSSNVSRLTLPSCELLYAVQSSSNASDYS